VHYALESASGYLEKWTGCWNPQVWVWWPPSAKCWCSILLRIILYKCLTRHWNHKEFQTCILDFAKSFLNICVNWELISENKRTHFSILWCICVLFQKFNYTWFFVFFFDVLRTSFHNLRGEIWVVWTYCCFHGNQSIRDSGGHSWKSKLGVVSYCV
jgi:hypothetical protein